VQRLEQQGYRFSFDDDTPDEVVETTLDIVFSDCEADPNDVDDAGARQPVPLLPHDDETAGDAEC
jgi:hypothetical protein